MNYLKRNKGFTLLEVLIAVLIFSLGMLGSAGLMVLSVRTNHSAYLRTQASFLADSMVDRMRSNVGWTNDYNGSFNSSTDASFTCTTCTPGNLVERDKAQWAQQLKDSLPNPAAVIRCEGDNLGSAAQRGSAPYVGLCNMTISWTEADLDRDSDVPATQTFAWVFQP